MACIPCFEGLTHRLRKRDPHIMGTNKSGRKPRKNRPVPPIRTTWGKIIKRLQDIIPIDDADLCAALKISRQTLWAYKYQPKRRPSQANQRVMAHYFSNRLGREITVDDIFGRGKENADSRVGVRTILPIPSHLGVPTPPEAPRLGLVIIDGQQRLSTAFKW